MVVEQADILINFKAEAEAIRDELITRRRDFHRYPELAYEEFRTSGIIASELNRLGLEVQSGLATTGIVAVLEGAEDGPTVLYRADMDALPITEETGHNFTSENTGIMHACAHDGHMSIALGVAQIMAKHRDKLKGRIKFIFQPAEEGKGGALAMIRDGALDEEPVPEYALGLHLWQPLKLGKIGVGKGAVMSGSSTFQIVVRGHGGHAAMPHTTIDPVACTGQLITALHTIVGRRMNAMDGAVVLSVTGLQTSTIRHNIIPETVEITGTFRTFNALTSELLEQHIRDVSNSVCESVGCEADVRVKHLTIPLVNDSDVVDKMRRALMQIVDLNALDKQAKTMASEDMSYYLDDVPGMYFLVGCRGNDERYRFGHHHPKFDFDEEVLPLGTAIMSTAIADFLIPEHAEYNLHPPIEDED